MSDPLDLLMRYDAWDENRAWLSAREEAGEPVNWALSDDEGVDLLHDMAETLRRVVDQ